MLVYPCADRLLLSRKPNRAAARRAHCSSDFVWLDCMSHLVMLVPGLALASGVL